MTVAASAIISRVRDQLIDTSSVHWSDAELLRWISDAQRVLAAALPQCTATTATVTTTAGAKQTLPSGGHTLLTVHRNTGGKAIQNVPRAVLDGQNPGWMNETAAAVAKAYSYDVLEPLIYWLYPPANGQSIDITYSAVPAELSATSDNLTVLDIYAPAVTDYVLYRAHSKDSDANGQPGVGKMYYDSFATYVTGGKGAG